MKKSTIISIALIILGLIFEGLYLMSADYTFLSIKFNLLGVFCLIAGVLGLWLFSILPGMGNKK